MRLYLVRHGQAGLRHRYDTLSALGRLQARRLGESFVCRKLVFAEAYCGALERQRETAAEVCAAYREAGVAFPEIRTDPGWSEFDLDGVYREVAPALCAADPDFRRRYEALVREAEDDRHAVHHTWSPCDTEIVNAWIEGRFETAVESWAAFTARVRRIRERIAEQPGTAVAIFTSAVPIAIWAAMSTNVPESGIMRFAAVMYNSAVTSFRLHGGDLLLFSFNTVPHLAEPEMLTFR
jgi:broad specificity phosphatase PhoE